MIAGITIFREGDTIRHRETGEERRVEHVLIQRHRLSVKVANVQLPIPSELLEKLYAPDGYTYFSNDHS